MARLRVEGAARGGRGLRRRRLHIPELMRFDVATEEGLRRFRRGLIVALFEKRVTAGTARLLDQLSVQIQKYEQKKRSEAESIERVHSILERFERRRTAPDESNEGCGAIDP
jgi:hypothetical protein